MNLSDVNIASERLTLTSFNASDAAEIFAAVTPSLTRYLAFEPSPTAEVFAGIWRTWAPKMVAGSDLFLVIRRRDTGAFCGRRRAAGDWRAGAGDRRFERLALLRLR